jgi:hypothetical protein
MKTIGIEIDGVLRDYLTKFDEQYRKVFIYNPSLVAMNDDFTVREQSEAEIEEIEQERERLESELLTLPVSTSNLTNHYRFDSETIDFTVADSFDHEDEDGSVIKGIESVQEDITRTPEENLEYFINEKYPFQIFANAVPFKRAVDAFHRLQSVGKETGEYEVVLLSTLKAQAIAATYFFLSKQGCRPRSVRFVDTHEDKWKYCDILIDVNSDALDYKDDDEKVSIKIKGDMTKYSDADYEADSLYSLVKSGVIGEILNK